MRVPVPPIPFPTTLPTNPMPTVTPPDPVEPKPADRSKWNDHHNLNRETRVRIEMYHPEDLTSGGIIVPIQISDEDLISMAWVSDKDIFDVSDPIQELDLTLSNINGEWDKDNPSSYFYGKDINGWYLSVGFDITFNGIYRYFVPIGFFQIANYTYDEDNFRITAFSFKNLLVDSEMKISWDSLGRSIWDGRPHNITEESAITELTSVLVSYFGFLENLISVDVSNSPTKDQYMFYVCEDGYTAMEQIDQLFANRLVYYRMKFNRMGMLKFTYSGNAVPEMPAIPYDYDEQIEEYPQRDASQYEPFSKLSVSYIDRDSGGTQESYDCELFSPRGKRTEYSPVWADNPSQQYDSSETWARMKAYRLLNSPAPYPEIYKVKIFDACEISVGDEIWVHGKYGLMRFYVLSHELTYEGGFTESTLRCHSLPKATWGDVKASGTRKWSDYQHIVYVVPMIGYPCGTWMDIARGFYNPLKIDVGKLYELPDGSYPNVGSSGGAIPL